MVNSTPKPLVRGRLEQIIRGLRIRSESSAQDMERQVGVLTQQMESVAQQHGLQSEEFAQQSREQRKATITAWDEALCSAWDQREGATHRAIVEARGKEAKLRKRAEDELKTAQSEKQRRTTTADQLLETEKRKPNGRLANYRKVLRSHLESVAGLVGEAEESIQQRSLRVPKAGSDDATYEASANSKEALERCVATVEAAKAHCKRLTNQPLATFVESGWWWGIVLLFFAGLTAALIYAFAMPPLQSVIAGAVSSAALLLLGILCVRPLLTRVAKTEYPALLHCRTLLKRQSEHALLVCEQEVGTEIGRLETEHADSVAKIQAWTKNRIEEVQAALTGGIKTLRDKCEKTKAEMSHGLTEDLSSTENGFETRQAKEDAGWQTRIQAATDELEREQQSCQDRIQELQDGGATRLKIATEKASDLVSRSEAWCDANFVDWNVLANEPSNWPILSRPCVPLGKLIPGDEPVEVAAVKEAESATLLFSPIEDKYLTITGSLSQESTTDLVRAIVLRFLATLPQGRAQVCIVDPPGLGRDFGWLMHLADFDAELVSHRVWTQTSHIAKQIDTLARGAEDFIQQSLRDQFSDIEAYNAEAGALAEPFRIMVWSSFPDALDEPTWQAMQSILDTGARCGIIPIFLIDTKNDWRKTPQAAQLMRSGMHLEFTEETSQLVVRSDEDSFPLKPVSAPNESVARQLVSEIGRAALKGSRVEVPLAKMLPERDQWWTADSSRSLEIPIGQSGVGRTHCLTLGVGTAQHAILAGKTGSGKSSLLHALITSAMCKYSPESLRLVLLDFKKGVEFQVYSSADVPHADIIGIESHREFGLSALRYIDEALQQRGELFRDAGVQDIAQWNALRTDDSMPRMLLVIDEFQELFVEDDAISRDASLILDRIVRQGRSFGVHAILSSQTLAGAYSLPRTTLGQMAVRIALQCDASDAQIIFAEDNPAAQRLRHPGQAVYNDAGGRIEGNQPMQIGWMDKQEQVEWFSQMESGYRNRDATTNRLGRRVVYDGNSASTWNSANADLAVRRAKENVNPDACWCVAGDSVAIEPAVVFPLTSQPGRNVLIVGGDDSMAAAVLNSIVSSWTRHVTRPDGAVPRLYTIQGARPTDPECLKLPAMWDKYRCDATVVDARDASGLVSQVHAVLKKRLDADDDAGVYPPVLLSILQLGRVRDLKKGDEFSFGEAEESADKLLEEILRDGPGVGIHTVCWAESQSTVGRWLSRGSLREMEIRLAMQMSANDSSNLIESVSASKLGNKVMLMYDDATGQEAQFRPASVNGLADVAQWQETSL